MTRHQFFPEQHRAQSSGDRRSSPDPNNKNFLPQKQVFLEPFQAPDRGTYLPKPDERLQKLLETLPAFPTMNRLQQRTLALILISTFLAPPLSAQQQTPEATAMGSTILQTDAAKRKEGYYKKNGLSPEEANRLASLEERFDGKALQLENFTALSAEERNEMIDLYRKHENHVLSQYVEAQSQDEGSDTIEFKPEIKIPFLLTPEEIAEKMKEPGSIIVLSSTSCFPCLPLDIQLRNLYAKGYKIYLISDPAQIATHRDYRDRPMSWPTIKVVTPSGQIMTIADAGGKNATEIKERIDGALSGKLPVGMQPDFTGILTTEISTEKEGPHMLAPISSPYLAVSGIQIADGFLIINHDKSTIDYYNRDGEWLRSIANHIEGEAEIYDPRKIRSTPNGGVAIVEDSAIIMIFNAQGKLEKTIDFNTLESSLTPFSIKRVNDFVIQGDHIIAACYMIIAANDNPIDVQKSESWKDAYLMIPLKNPSAFRVLETPDGAPFLFDNNNGVPNASRVFNTYRFTTLEGKTYFFGGNPDGEKHLYVHTEGKILQRVPLSGILPEKYSRFAPEWANPKGFQGFIDLSLKNADIHSLLNDGEYLYVSTRYPEGYHELVEIDPKTHKIRKIRISNVNDLQVILPNEPDGEWILLERDKYEFGDYPVIFSAAIPTEMLLANPVFDWAAFKKSLQSESSKSQE